jgi:hypothetical protein
VGIYYWLILLGINPFHYHNKSVIRIPRFRSSILFLHNLHCISIILIIGVTINATEIFIRYVRAVIVVIIVAGDANNIVHVVLIDFVVIVDVA